MNIESTLFIGYGNPDRQDDGVAWHILAGLSQKLGRRIPEFWDEPFPLGNEFPHMIFELQLNPEIAETIANYKNICFVDAHTGNIPNDIQFGEVIGAFQTNPFTHHMPAETVLALTKSIYKAEPKAFLLSVRGYSFGFTQDLSPQTAFLAAIAITKGWDWLESLTNN